MEENKPYQTLKKEFVFYDAHSHEGNDKHTISVQNQILGDELIDFSKNTGQLYSVGIHPWYVKDESYRQLLEHLDGLLTESNVVAVGECGLDKLSKTDWDLQKRVFEAQISISERFKKPLVIHSVRADSEILNLRKHLHPKETWMIHGFCKSPQMAEQLIESGCMLSFGYALLKGTSKNEDLIKKIPLQDFLIESDEKRIILQDLYRKIAEIKQISLLELKEIQQENFKRFYKID